MESFRLTCCACVLKERGCIPTSLYPEDLLKTVTETAPVLCMIIDPPSEKKLLSPTHHERDCIAFMLLFKYPGLTPDFVNKSSNRNRIFTSIEMGGGPHQDVIRSIATAHQSVWPIANLRTNHTHTHMVDSHTQTHQTQYPMHET